MSSQGLIQGGPGLYAGKGFYRFTVLEHHQCRDGADAVATGEILVRIDIDLAHGGATGEFFGHLVQHRGDDATGAAPLRPEIHQHGLARPDDFLIEVAARHSLWSEFTHRIFLLGLLS